MSGVLHPAGPEPASTYWLRRALVAGVLAVLVAIVVALIPHASRPRQAVPAPAASTTATVPDATPSMTSVAPVEPTVSPTAHHSSAGKSSALPTSSRPTTSSDSTTSSKSAKKVLPTKPPTPALCDSSNLRPTLTGQPRLHVKQSNMFNLSLINGGQSTCRVSVNAENFELKIYSGKDKIWTSGDCSTSVRSIDLDVATQKAAVWRMTWNGRRSAAGCKSRPEIPKPGTYVATAQLADVKPVRFRMTLTG